MTALLLALAVSPAEAGRRTFNEGLVVGANVVVALGGAGSAGEARVGAGLDLGYEVQWYSEESQRIDGTFTVWAEEHAELNYGPVVHLWKVGPAWQTSAGARLGVAWPLRVGLLHGWIPGPGAAVELAPTLSTAGYVGLDLQGVLGAPFVEGRAGATLTAAGLRASRVHVGLATPLVFPENWPETQGDVWDPDRTVAR